MISVPNTSSNIKSNTTNNHQTKPDEYYARDYSHQRSIANEHTALDSFSFDEIPRGAWDATQFSEDDFDSALKEFGKVESLLMQQPDSAGVYSSHFPPNLGRGSHQREPSLSSLGSAGPASPFTSNTSNPRIAVTDSTSEGVPDMYNNSSDGTSQPNGIYYQVAKPMDAFSGYQNLEAAMPEMAYPMTLSSHSRPRADRGLLPAADMNSFLNRSHPASVASSVAGDSPATPTMTETDQADRGRRVYGNVPKLARTMTDVYGDELYNPNFAITSSSPAQSHTSVSPSSQVFSQRINAANSQHLSAAHSPSSTAPRALSPFRACSPFAPPQTNDFGICSSNNNGSFNSVQRMRHRSEAQSEPHTLRQTGGVETEPDTPNTISPKDAVLEFNDVDGEPSFSLFPPGGGTFDFDTFGKSLGSESDQMATQLSVPQDPLSGSQQGMFPSAMPFENRMPQQYPFISRRQTIQDTSPPRLSSSGSSSAESDGKGPASRGRPARPGADSGTYTCTYHGCTLRFDTPAQLQKHKREGHRHTQNLGVPHLPEAGITSNLLNSQAGPHRCDRINPSTGKPCGTIFSRPYDLTRHEDTIHNERKLKVRCDLCTVEKTFSRADALTRHYRVCHPEAELPGKLRRRG